MWLNVEFARRKKKYANQWDLIWGELSGQFQILKNRYVELRCNEAFELLYLVDRHRMPSGTHWIDQWVNKLDLNWIFFFFKKPLLTSHPPGSLQKIKMEFFASWISRKSSNRDGILIFDPKQEIGNWAQSVRYSPTNSSFTWLTSILKIPFTL